MFWIFYVDRKDVICHLFKRGCLEVFFQLIFCIHCTYLGYFVWRFGEFGSRGPSNPDGVSLASLRSLFAIDILWNCDMSAHPTLFCQVQCVYKRGHDGCVHFCNLNFIVSDIYRHFGLGNSKKDNGTWGD